MPVVHADRDAVTQGSVGSGQGLISRRAVYLIPRAECYSKLQFVKAKLVLHNQTCVSPYMYVRYVTQAFIVINYTFFPQLRKTLLLVCTLVALVPFPYVVTRPTQVREKRCLPTKSLQINDSTSRIRINYQIFKVASKTPSYVQIVQLFCKTGYFLALNVTAKKNRIIGIVNQSSESSKSMVILTSLPSPRGECSIKCIILLVILFQVVT